MNKKNHNNAAALQRTNQLKTLQSALERTASVWRTSIPSTMAKLLAPERVTKIVMLAASRQGSGILRCTEKSIIRSVADAVSLGLEPGGPLGHAYLVPFKNKQSGQMECQLIIGYRGLVNLARRSGNIASVEAHAYYANDRAKITLGTDSRIEHEPCMDGDRGELKGVYAIARFVGGGSHMDFMSKHDVDRIRAKSPGKDSPAWNNHYDEMAKKTVVRRASKYWPLCVEMADAQAQEDEALKEASADIEDAGVIDMSFEEADNDATEADAQEASPEDKEAEAEALHRGRAESAAPEQQGEDDRPVDYKEKVRRIMETKDA